MNCTGSYCVDADHMGLKNVDFFMEASVFTLDVADFMGKSASDQAVAEFVRGCEKYIGVRFHRLGHSADKEIVL